MKYAGHRLNLRDAPKVVKMLCSPAQSGTSGHPTLHVALKVQQIDAFNFNIKKKKSSGNHLEIRNN